MNIKNKSNKKVVYLSQDELNIISNKAQEDNRSISSFLRKSALDKSKELTSEVKE